MLCRSDWGLLEFPVTLNQLASIVKSLCICQSTLGIGATTAIGRFYNGRDHSTVCHSIQRIEALRETNPEVDTLLADLKRRILENDGSERQDPHDGSLSTSALGPTLEQLADLITERVCAYLERRLQKLA